MPVEKGKRINILIMLGNISPSDDANTNIAKLIAAELRNQGHFVSMLGTTFVDCKESELVDGIVYYRIIRKETLKERGAEWKKADCFRKKNQFMFKHPLSFAIMLFRHLRSMLFDPREKLYQQQIKALLKRNMVDRIIAITSPFYVVTAALKAAKFKHVEVVWYQLDPNHSNVTMAYKRKKNLIGEEEEVYKRIEFAVIPKLVYEENISGTLAVYNDKMKPAEFPNVRRLLVETVKDDIVFDFSKINIVFVGTFYEDIRNPSVLLEIITQLKDERMVFHFVGGGCEEIIESWRKKCGSRLRLHGYHSLQSALNAMSNADFLINVDNTAKNMLPSKINDYISTCKPIINIHPFSESASAAYLGRYPLCLNLCMEVLSVEEMAEKIYEFCVVQEIKDLHFNEVEDLYPESTPSYISNLLMSDITEN